MNNLFYNNIEKNELNNNIISKIEEYVNDNPTEQIYLITAPLGENKYNYSYEKNAIVILSPKHRIIFLNLNNSNKDDFEEYYEDFVEDLGSISDKFNYKKHIGRPRKWQNELTTTDTLNDDFNIKFLLVENRIEKDLERNVDFLISLLVGSINDIEEKGLNNPESLLEKVKKNIILFDGEQTRFIYQKLNQKRISIQGLSGTGKTELLLHKLKEIYTSEEESKTFFTCHNITLANTLKSRIPSFFNFMKVDKQIQWNEQLWVDRAWGSQRDKNSGLYTYICHFYNIPFIRFQKYPKEVTYEMIFKSALAKINLIDENDFKCAFDYVLIDERQDFPDVFFELCEKITRKQVYIAGDIFQDIFDHDIEQRVVDVDFVLNKCYRTDPKILMFAHSIGMGLFEEKKLNWLKDSEWKVSGYKIERKGRETFLSRDAVRRFEELETENISSMNIEKLEGFTQIINIIKRIKDSNPTVKPDDIAIIILDTHKSTFDTINKLEFQIAEQLNWKVNKSHESKRKIEDTLFISNKNNVKGLEFPFVICITAKILDTYSYRNTLYTMLTRSFLQSFLLVKDDSNLEVQKKGLEIIQIENYIQTIEPTEEEKKEIKKTIIKVQEENNMSFKEFLLQMFDECKVDRKKRKNLENMIRSNDVLKESFDKEKIENFIRTNEEFC